MPSEKKLRRGNYKPVHVSLHKLANSYRVASHHSEKPAPLKSTLGRVVVPGGTN